MRGWHREGLWFEPTYTHQKKFKHGACPERVPPWACRKGGTSWGIDIVKVTPPNGGVGPTIDKIIKNEPKLMINFERFNPKKNLEQIEAILTELEG